MCESVHECFCRGVFDLIAYLAHSHDDNKYDRAILGNRVEDEQLATGRADAERGVKGVIIEQHISMFLL